MRVEKSFSSTALAEALGEIDGLDDELAAGGGGLGGELGPAGPQDPAGALGAQCLEPPAPAFVAAAPGGDAAQIPILLGGDALLQALGLALLALDQLLRPGLEAGEAGVELMQPAALEPEHAGREAREEGAVMADEEQRALEAQQHLLEPFDGRQVEVVGGLVQQQQIGIAGQRPGQGRAPALAARKPGGIARSVEAEAVEEGGDPMRRCPLVPRGGRGDEIRQARKAAEFRLLGQHAHTEARLQEAAAGIDLHAAGQDLQDGRFARAIGAHQRDPLAAPDAEIDIGEERPSAEGQPGATQRRDGRRGGHGSAAVRQERAQDARQCPVPCRSGHRRR